MSPRRALLPAAIALLAALGVGLALISSVGRSREDVGRRQAAVVTADRMRALERHLDRVLAAGRALKTLLEREGWARFEILATDLLATFPEARGLLLYRGGEVVALQPPRADELSAAPRALAAAPAAGFSWNGPFRTDGGQRVLYVLLPGLDGGGTEGILVATLLADLLDAADLSSLAGEGYVYELSRSGERRRLVARSTELELAEPVRAAARIGDGEWTLAVAPREGWQGDRPRAPEIAVAALLALLSALFTYGLARQPELLRRQVEQRTRRLESANRRLTEEMFQRERAEERLRHDAFHDGLTGLPNRAYLLHRLERALERAQRQPGYSVAVLFLDLDRFKNVNDSFGHGMGDELLLALSRRLEVCLRPQDVIARLGGDEFALLLFDIGSPETAVRVAERVQQAMVEPFLLAGQEVFTSASIGIATSSGEYQGPADLLQDADIAMYHAKREGTGRLQLFAPAMRREAVSLLKLETDLRRAIDRRQFELRFQPIVGVTDQALAGFEVLVRWNHPEEGVMAPGRFLRLAEETGLVVEIDRWVLAAACRQARSWSDRLGTTAPYVSVNLSGRHLRQADVGDHVAAVLADTAVPPQLLSLEITESVVMTDARAAGILLTRLKDMDVRLFIDDFGTGYSSLSYLHHFPFDTLKIDRSFISRLGPSGENSEIVQTILSLAHQLGMKAVAEGVETATQLELLRTLGCDYAQGYLFAQPLEEIQASELIRKNQRQRRRAGGRR